MNIFKSKHTNKRYFERVHPDIASKKDIVKALQHPNNLEYIKKLTQSRSMVYIHLPNDSVVKAIINKRKKELVTILPWKGVYTVEVPIEDNFIVHLFPDCYMETKNPSTLNKVISHWEEYIGEEEVYKEEVMPYNHPMFQDLVEQAWMKHILEEPPNEEDITEKEIDIAEENFKAKTEDSE